MAGPGRCHQLAVTTSAAAPLWVSCRPRLWCGTLCLLLWSLRFAQAAVNAADPPGVLNNTRTLLYNTQRNIHANISELLDNLLRGYDNSVRPDFGGNASVARVGLSAHS